MYNTRSMVMTAFGQSANWLLFFFFGCSCNLFTLFHEKYSAKLLGNRMITLPMQNNKMPRTPIALNLNSAVMGYHKVMRS